MISLQNGKQQAELQERSNPFGNAGTAGTDEPAFYF